jgi:hypothetical protein
MSHAARIDFEALSLTARITCEAALKQLCKMDTILERVKNAASELLTERVKGYEAYLLKERTNLQDEINKVIEKSKTQNRDQNIANVASNLNDLVNDLMTNRLMMIENVIDEELIKTVNQLQQEQKEKREGMIHISQEQLRKLSEIEDFALREEVYKLLVEMNTNDFNALIGKAEQNLVQKNDEILKNKKQQLVANIQKDLHGAGVEEDIIQEVVSKDINSISDLHAMNESASKEMIGEKVRKETLKIISNTIKSRGFIVDKKNIKLDRGKNEVKLIAQKASGERAEFRIYLDGKFIYKFDGYEGQACQKDLQPFMSDLADIYDVKVLKQTEIWSNPDKISTMKYQTINKNKGTN